MSPGPQPRLTAAAIDATRMPDEVLVAQSPGSPDSVVDTAAQRLGLLVLERTDIAVLGARVSRIGIPDGRSIEQVIAALAAEPDIGLVQPNHIYRRQQQGAASARAPSPESPAPDGQTVQYALRNMSADAAHRASTGRDVVIAVIDTGVDSSHPDIAAAKLSSRVIVDLGAPAELAHGTSIAGIIAANGTTRGMAPDARILSIRAFAASPPSGRTAPHRSTSMVVLKAVDAAMATAAQVLNLSFAGPRDALLEQALAEVVERRTVVVAAAGNEGAGAPPAYPAAYSGVIAVTAIDARDRQYAHANRGAYITVAAPGVEVLAASADHGHELVSGTSFATAHVSALVALLLQVAPDLTPAEIIRAIQETARDLGAPGYDPVFGAGATNAAAVLGHELVTTQGR
jgi:subtilisin family serine protease